LIYYINVFLLQIVLIIIFLFCLLQSDPEERKVKVIMKDNVIFIFVVGGFIILLAVQYLFYTDKNL